MASKFKKLLEQIWEQNKELFLEFFILNQDYDDPKKRRDLEEQFQEIGQKVKTLLQQGENDLCRQTEKSEHRTFSSKLADKYWDEVRKYFKYMDLVGVVSK